MTITAQGDLSYYRGETVRFSGTNTDSNTVFLFLTGPNLPENGARFTLTPKNDAVINGDAGSFTQVPVNAGGTWSYNWDMASVSIDVGIYTAYAVSAPRDKAHLSGVSSSARPIIIKTPFISGYPSKSVITRGDTVYIRGTAEGEPSTGVALWIFGDDYTTRTIVPVQRDATFEYQLNGATTQNMPAGMYNIVLQHPDNNQFDIDYNTDTGQVINRLTGELLFSLKGSNSLKGSAAYDALVNAIKDTPNIDDTYTKLPLVVDDPLTGPYIRFDPIKDRYVGDKFTVAASTSLPVGTEVIYEISRSSYKPEQSSKSIGFSGVTGVAKVAQGTTGGANKIVFDVDTSTLAPDEYTLKATSVNQEATGNVTFNVFEGSAPVPIKTTVTPVSTQTKTSQPSVTEVDNAGFSLNSIMKNPGYVVVAILVVVIIAGFGMFQYRKRAKPSSSQSYRPPAPIISTAPQSPVNQFTPQPVTPKQLPQELSHKFVESEFIGKGGFARVFKAKRKDGQYVAVKIPISIDEATGRSFIAELQNWTRLDHPNIVKVYNFNIMPTPYFEMELCDSSLADVKKPIGSEEAAWILFNISEGLKFTHSQKIIHRDLKPQNILLKNGVPKISDWGLSKVISESTSTTATSFTPYYAAPEQIGNKPKDERTDIWQLGVIFYELVTGLLPFTGDSMVEVMAGIATKTPQLPSQINPDAKEVEPVILKCLEKDPAKRYQSVLELQKALALYLRVTYTESLKLSVTANDLRRSASYCGDLVMVNLLTGDMKSAYKYLTDLVNYAEGDVKTLARELSEQIKMRMEMGVTEIPDELIQKAEIIVHKVSVGFRMMR